MRLNFLLFIVTGFLLVDVYYDNKYSKMLKVNKKYIKMGMIGFTALTIYLFFKKYPSQGGSMLKHANEIIKYMPIDKNSRDLITPIIDMTTNNESSNLQQQMYEMNSQVGGKMTPQMKRMMNSGKQQNTKRSVSETKKKFVASRQQWRCNDCQQQLDHTYEVDHIKDLRFGGDNSVDNLVALCRNCHGKKTLACKL